MATSKLRIPKSLHAEHEAIYSALVEATQAPGRIGAAATDLIEALRPHFKREEQIALPLLGLLASLAGGEQVPGIDLSDALSMIDSLRSELPRMLEEHKTIHAAIENLRLAARTPQTTKYEQLAEQLALHARTEEEVLYPAAILLGDVIRARLQRK